MREPGCTHRGCTHGQRCQEKDASGLWHLHLYTHTHTHTHTHSRTQNGVSTDHRFCSSCTVFYGSSKHKLSPGINSMSVPWCPLCVVLAIEPNHRTVHAVPNLCILSLKSPTKTTYQHTHTHTHTQGNTHINRSANLCSIPHPFCVCVCMCVRVCVVRLSVHLSPSLCLCYSDILSLSLSFSLSVSQTHTVMPHTGTRAQAD